MGTLHLVRHGQASFGAADYDHLSALGAQQCAALGAYLRERGVRFDAVLLGSLRRHRQSLAALADGYGALPDARTWPALDEYDGHALVAAARAAAGDADVEAGADADADAYRAHFRWLRSGLTRWIAGEHTPPGMPRHADWVAGIVAVLDHVRADGRGDVLVVSSGGPIATAVAHVLQAPHAAAVELNLRIRNSALTELAYSARRLALVAFNQVPHLEDPARRGWQTYS